MADLTKLFAIARPPESPLYARGDLLGPACSEEVRQLAEAYGVGTFAEFLHLHSPYAHLACQRPQVDEGVLVWAFTDNGDAVGLEGECVCVRPARAHLVEPLRWALGPVDWLAGWLSGDVRVPCFPPRDRYFDPSFERFHEWRYVDFHLAFVEGAFADRFDLLEASLPGARVRGFVANDEGYSVGRLQLVDGTKLQLSDNRHHGSRLNVLVAPEHELAVQHLLLATVKGLGWPLTRLADAKGQPVWR